MEWHTHFSTHSCKCTQHIQYVTTKLKLNTKLIDNRRSCVSFDCDRNRMRVSVKATRSAYDYESQVNADLIQSTLCATTPAEHRADQ